MAHTWNAAGWLAAWQHTEGAVWLLLIAVAGPYAIGVSRVWRRAGIGRGISRAAVAWYAAGCVVLALAVASPLDAMADTLFSAHMTEHLLLVAVVPPMLIAGAPSRAGAWLWRAFTAAPARTAQWTGATMRAIGRVPVWLAWLLHTATLWTWHLPSLYQLALREPPWHALEHAAFLATALLLWWTVYHPRGVRRNGYAIGVLAMLATAMQSGALGALLASTRTVWYPLQDRSVAAWGLTPLADQQLAGLIMWVPGGIIYVVAACVLFLAWLKVPASSAAIAPAGRPA
jgi:putative membrane protein